MNKLAELVRPGRAGTEKSNAPTGAQSPKHQSTRPRPELVAMSGDLRLSRAILPMG
ncbi:hypothetical protein FHW92_004989 [Novosphingobium sp. SG707]|nr:hypothetical protein [Novosphingobium sp. SG707]